MPLARKHQIPESTPGFYHCMSRCVRRAWLCGVDPLTLKNFDHRREWLVERMISLSDCFAVDVYAYSAMSNHLHTVLYVDPERVAHWSDDDVIRRWKIACNWRNPELPPTLPTSVPPRVIKRWRRRLGSVSWYMRLVKEPIARIANAEDGCTGRFWEGRFKSLPLLDDAAVIACMAYVDLNPIRAGVAKTPEDSDYTSIQQRIQAKLDPCIQDSTQAGTLQPIGKPNGPNSVPLATSQYEELVRSSAGERLAEADRWRDELVTKLGLNPSGWSAAVSEFLSLFRSAAGSDAMLARFMETMGRVRKPDVAARRLVYR